MSQVDELLELTSDNSNAVESLLSDTTEKEQESVSMGRGLPQQALQGLSFNFGDEITAAITAIPAAIATGTGIGESYADILQNVRREQKQFSHDNPKTSFVANMAGGMLTGGYGSAKALAASTLPIATKAAGVGALTGGISGIGAGETAEERKGQAATGAALGGILGFGTPFVKDGATWLAGATANKLRQAFTTQESRALRHLATRMDGDDIVQAHATIRNLGEDASLVDIDNLKGIAKGITQDSTKYKPIAKNFLVNRLKSSKNRLREVITRQTGSSLDNVEQEVEQIANSMSQRAAPLYREGYRVGLPQEASDTLNSISKNNKTIQKALKEAFDEANDDLRLPRELKAGLDVENPNIVMWDYAQRTLRDKSDSLFNSGKPQQATRVLDTQKRIVSLLEKNNLIKEARKIWRGGKQAQEALDIGMDVFSEARKKGADSIRRSMANMSDDEKQLVRLGMGAEMNRIINNTPDTVEGRPAASMLRNLFGDDNKKKAVKLFLGDDERAYASFARKINQESEYLRSANSILGNSDTTEKLAEIAAMQVDASGVADVARGMNSGSPLAAGLGVIKAIGRVFDGKKAKDEASRELARRLFSSDTDLILDTLDGIQRETNILPDFAQKLVNQESLSNFLSNPENAEKLSLFIAGTLGGKFNEKGEE